MTGARVGALETNQSPRRALQLSFFDIAGVFSKFVSPRSGRCLSLSGSPADGSLLARGPMLSLSAS